MQYSLAEAVFVELRVTDREAGGMRGYPRTGGVLEGLEMPAGTSVSGLESDGGERFFAAGGNSGNARAVRRPNRDAAAGGGSRTPAGATRKQSKRPSPARHDHISMPEASTATGWPALFVAPDSTPA
jgi:hypothetical protein